MTLDALTTEAVSLRLEEVRARTLALVSTLDWSTLRRQHVPILSPMVWDLGHVANFEEIWLGRNLAGRPSLEARYERMFDAVENPRPTRASLPLPERRELFSYLERVRDRTLADLRSPAVRQHPLAEGGFVFELVAQHEEQHQETLLQAMQLLTDPPYLPPVRRPLPTPSPVAEEMVEIPGGPFRLGAARSQGFVYDNELEQHEVDLPCYRIDRFPVTNRAFLEFVEAGGYHDPGRWSPAGRRWLEESGAEAPGHWVRGADGWSTRFLGRVTPVDPRQPVVHVCFHEAEAYARFAGKRLPTEAEWEKAALWDPAAHRPRRHPWGDAPPSRRLANVDQLGFQPAPIGAYPEGRSAYGVEQTIGDVWEWTDSDFVPYPGFRAHPYPEYSEIFFGSAYKILRGGSWATRPAVARGTFRNWDYPIRRQIFAGFRCAADG